MPRPQFTLRALLVLMLAVACFFSGIHFERERQRREDEAAALAAKSKAMVPRPLPPNNPANMWDDPKQIDRDQFDPGYAPPADQLPAPLNR